MQFKLLHCWDCGEQVVGQGYSGTYALPNLKEVIFDCNDGSYMESPFCSQCAEKPWPAERVEEFRKAVALVNPRAILLKLKYRQVSTRDHSGGVRVVQ